MRKYTNFRPKYFSPLKNKKPAIEPFVDLGFAKLDLHRAERKGFPEVVFCQGKTLTQVLTIASRLFQTHRRVLLTRVTAETGRRLKRRFGRGRYYPEARLFYAGTIPIGIGLVTVLSAGTADIPIAEEAAITAEVMGSRVKRIFDVGVAGIHRLVAYQKQIAASRVLVIVAGMDGVLPSVAGGLFHRPIIAVPTSIGYGLNLGGVAPLLTMLNSCAPGIAVVNIDNGFGAGYLASVINRR